MGVAAVAGLDATTTTVASFANDLTINASGFTNTTTNAATFSSKGIFNQTNGGITKTCATPGKHIDIAFRYTVASSTVSVSGATDHLSIGLATSATLNAPSILRIGATIGQGFFMDSVDAAGTATTLLTASQLPPGAYDGVYDYRLIITEAGYLTFTCKYNGTTYLLADGMDVTGYSFWTASTAGAVKMRWQNNGGTSAYLSNVREVSHPVGQIVRNPRNSLLQLTDGTSAWAEAATSATSTTIIVWRDRKDGSTPVQLANFTVATRMYTPPVLTRDASDNLYFAWSGATIRYYRGLTKSGSGASATWALGNQNSVNDTVPYTIRSLVVTSTGHLIACLWRNQSAVDALFAGLVANLAGGTFSDAKATNGAVTTGAGFARVAILSGDAAAPGTGGIWVYAATQAVNATVTVVRWTIASDGTMNVTTLGNLTLDGRSLSLVRTGTGTWVLTALNAAGTLVAVPITTTTVGSAFASTVSVTAVDSPLGGGDAWYDGTYVWRALPSDFGASSATTSYVRARFNPTGSSWASPASFDAIAGQAKEETTHVATGPLTLAPQVTRSDGTTDWLITSLGAPSAGGSAAYTVHDTDVAKATVSGTVKNADGSTYTGGASVALLRADGTVIATTTSSTTDGTWSMPVGAGAALYEVVAFSADATQTAAAPLRTTA